MNYNDRFIRQIYFRIRFLKFGIVPLRDLAKKDSNQGLWREIDFLRHAGNVVRRNDGPYYGRKVQDFDLSLLQLFVGHRTIRRSKIDGAFSHLSNSTAR